MNTESIIPLDCYSHLPPGWTVQPLGEVSINHDRRRKPLSKMQRANRSGPYPYYGAAKVFDYIDDFIFDGVYCLIAEDGSVITPDGRPVMQLTSGRFWANNHTHILQGRSPVTTRYLYYYLSAIDISGYITGVAQPKITQSNLNRIPVLVPPRFQMQKIAAILSAYDDLIENNRRRIKILEEMAQALYREWFVEFRFPGHEDVRMVDSPLGEIPEGWEVANLSSLAETQYGYTESAQEEPVGPKFLRGTDINKTSYITWDNVPYCRIDEFTFDKYRLFPGDVVVIRMADPGKPAIIERTVDAVFASYLVRISPVNPPLSLSPYYLFSFLSSERYQGYITGASTGTTRKSASAGVLTGIDLALPPEHILEQYEDRVSVIRRFMNVLLDANANLRHTRDLLLPRLISGELDVSDLEIDVGEEGA